MTKGNNKIALLSVLGVVYGDIGTSPLYVIKECLFNTNIILNNDSILGILSLVFWCLMLVVTFKYIFLILKADNHGEGGILSLLALLNCRRLRFFSNQFILILGFIGAALFFGDGLITPAISVLSALEGINLINSSMQQTDFNVILSIVVILLLFGLQKKGTTYIGKIFGPVMFFWFVVIGLLGLLQVIKNPIVFNAINPIFAISIVKIAPLKFLAIMGFVMLCVTGVEALYADMGHFSKKTIQKSWFLVVFPCLLLNYFGQGALVISNIDSGVITQNPFYEMAPKNFLIYMVFLSTIATIIASQSIISGVFSLFNQSVQLGYLPNMKIFHTSQQHYGRIYIPFVNWLLCISVILIVIIFKNSSELASVYGLSVSGLMLITSVMAMVAMRRVFKWNIALTIVVFGIIIIVDVLLFVSNVYKVSSGTFLPLLFAFMFFLVMHIWWKQNKYFNDLARLNSLTFIQFFQRFDKNKIFRVRGTAIFLSKDYNHVPYSLIKRMELANSLHEKVIILSIINHHSPYIPKEEKVFVQNFDYGFQQIIIHHGFMETPNAKSILKAIKAKGENIDIHDCHFVFLRYLPYFSGRIKFGMKKLRISIFEYLYKNSPNSGYLEIPAQKIIEIGVPIKIS